jgi:uncharacterized protein (DUF2126 family)
MGTARRTITRVRSVRQSNGARRCQSVEELMAKVERGLSKRGAKVLVVQRRDNNVWTAKVFMVRANHHVLAVGDSMEDALKRLVERLGWTEILKEEA